MPVILTQVEGKYAFNFLSYETLNLGDKSVMNHYGKL